MKLKRKHQIEKGIPLPQMIISKLPAEILATLPMIFPFNQMALWDSFRFSKAEHPKVQKEAFVKGRELDLKFAVSKVELRCWRVK